MWDSSDIVRCHHMGDVTGKASLALLTLLEAPTKSAHLPLIRTHLSPAACSSSVPGLPLVCVDQFCWLHDRSFGCRFARARVVVGGMKFGALLRNSAAELPELHQLFVSYKQLKKRLKRLPERQELVRQRERVAGGELPDVDVRELRQQEEAFVQVLDQDVQQFNRYNRA